MSKSEPAAAGSGHRPIHHESALTAIANTMSHASPHLSNGGAMGDHRGGTIL